MVDYSNKHWEELIGVIIERIGAERFVEMSAYVFEQRGYRRLTEVLGAAQFVASSETKVIQAFGSGVDQ